MCSLISNWSAQHTHIQPPLYTLATCRGFCCSAPPCSLKPHGAPPERKTTISSATIPALSSQPAAFVCVWECVWRCINLPCPPSVPLTLRVTMSEREAPVSRSSTSPRQITPPMWRRAVAGFHPLTLECCVGRVGTQDGEKGHSLCVCASFNTCHVTLKHSIQDGMLADIPSRNNHEHHPLFDPQHSRPCGSHGPQICPHLPTATLMYRRGVGGNRAPTVYILIFLLQILITELLHQQVKGSGVQSRPKWS